MKSRWWAVTARIAAVSAGVTATAVWVVFLWRESIQTSGLMLVAGVALPAGALVGAVIVMSATAAILYHDLDGAGPHSAPTDQTPVPAPADG